MSAEEPECQTTQRVAGEIEREATGVMTDTSRRTIHVEFGDHLPEEVAQIARSYGFTLLSVIGTTAKFVPEDDRRAEGGR